MSDQRTCEACHNLASGAIILPHGMIVLCHECKAHFIATISKAIPPAIPAIAQATRDGALNIPDVQTAEERCDFCHRLQFEDDITYFSLGHIFGLCEDCARLTEQIINNTFNVIKHTLSKEAPSTDA